MGDFVKGRPEGRYDGVVLEGIRAHRRVDAYTDEHPAVRRSFRRYRPEYRRYAGVLTDIFFDHVLARLWEEYADRPLRRFADDVYAELREARASLPGRMQRFLDYMLATDLLVSYRETEGVDRTLQGVSRRLRRSNPLGTAVEELEREADGFESDFREFFPDLLREFGAERRKP